MRYIANIEYFPDIIKADVTKVSDYFIKKTRSFAIKVRNQMKNKDFPYNNIMISIDKALELERSNRNKEAIGIIEETISENDEYENSYAILFFKLHLLLAQLYDKDGRIEESEEEYNWCIKKESNIYEENSIFNYDVHIGLGRVYCDAFRLYDEKYKYNWDYIYNFNYNIYLKLENNEMLYNAYYSGEVLFNIGYLYHIKEDLSNAMTYYKKALIKYEDYGNRRVYVNQVGIIRTKNKIVDVLFLEGDFEEAIKLMKEVVNISKRVYGKNHNQTIEFKAKLDELKNKR